MTDDRSAATTERGGRLGVFGGTFDPLHIGHLVLALEAAHRLELDRVLLVVAGEPWQKVAGREVTPAAHRLEMARLAVEHLAGLEVSDLEVRRPGPSYTADTLAELARLRPRDELFLLLGADAARGLPTWERVEEVRRLATVVVVERAGEDAAAARELSGDCIVEMPGIDLSSTELRARLAAGAPCDVLVPGPVLDYIRAAGLYRPDTAPPGSAGAAGVRGRAERPR